MAISIHDGGVSLSDRTVSRGDRGVSEGDGRVSRLDRAVSQADRSISRFDRGVSQGDWGVFLRVICISAPRLISLRPPSRGSFRRARMGRTEQRTPQTQSSPERTIDSRTPSRAGAQNRIPQTITHAASPRCGQPSACLRDTSVASRCRAERDMRPPRRVRPSGERRRDLCASARRISAASGNVSLRNRENVGETGEFPRQTERSGEISHVFSCAAFGKRYRPRPLLPLLAYVEHHRKN